MKLNCRINMKLEGNALVKKTVCSERKTFRKMTQAEMIKLQEFFKCLEDFFLV